MLFKELWTVIVVFVLHVLLVHCYSGSSKLSKQNSKSRQKRILSLITDPSLNFYFQYNSCYAVSAKESEPIPRYSSEQLAVVISLPLELPSSRSVFFSYNFETNYYYAYFDNAQGLTPVPFTYIDEPGVNLGTKNRIVLPPAYRQFNEDSQLINEQSNKTEKISDEKVRNKSLTNGIVLQDLDEKERKESSTENKQKEKGKARKVRTIFQNYFMSRRRFYKMMESKMDSSRLKGRDCLLKAICEAAADSFGQHNGVIGSVVDILFLPSTSKDENLPKRYYQAEANGKLRNCSVYDKQCPKTIFDFITKMI